MMKDEYKIIRKRAWNKDKHGAIEGLPLYLLIMVIIAVVAVAAILGFMIQPGQQVGDVKILTGAAGNPQLDNVRCTSKQANGDYWYTGNNVYSGATTSNQIVVEVKNSQGNFMSGATVKIEGLNYIDTKTTAGDGRAIFTLQNRANNNPGPISPMLSAGQTSGSLTVTISYPGWFGTSSKTTNIQVIVA